MHLMLAAALLAGAAWPGAGAQPAPHPAQARATPAAPGATPGASAPPAGPASARALARLHLAQARLAAAQGKSDRALAQCDQALRLDPDLYAARHLRAVLQRARGRLGAAERDLVRLVAARPTDLRLGRLLAAVRFAQKKWMWAARTLQRLVALSPRAGDLWLAFGVALLRLGASDEARRALTRARTLGPRPVAARARVLLALGRYDEGKLREALHLLGGASGPARGAAQALTRLIYESQGRANQGLDLIFRVGTGYDSNVSMDPADARASGSAGVLASAGVGLSWRGPTWGRHSLGASGTLERTFTINTWDDGSCVGDYSTLVGTVAPYWSVRFSTGRTDQVLRLGYRGQLVTLDGDCTEDSTFHVFMESHGGALDWTIRWSDTASTNVGVQVGGAWFRQQVRDQLDLALDLGQSFFLAKRRVKLYAALHLGYAHARGDWWTAVSARPSLAISSLLPGKVDLVGRLALDVGHYPQSAGYYPWQAPGNRTDVVLLTELLVGRAITSWLRADLWYRYRLNHSNARVWDYRRHAVGLSLTAKLQLLRPKKTSPKGGPS